MPTEHEDFGVVRPAAADPFCSYQDHAKLDFASVATDAPHSPYNSSNKVGQKSNKDSDSVVF